MFHVEITLTAPTMHAMGLESTTVYLTSAAGDVSTDRADARVMTSASAGMAAREWSKSYGVESARRVELPFDEEEWDQAPEVGTIVEIHNGQGGELGEILALRVGDEGLLYAVFTDSGHRMTLQRDDFTPVDH